ncbi:MAG: DUF4292 domain-containing protein [Leadbetterella sp.]
MRITLYLFLLLGVINFSSCRRQKLKKSIIELSAQAEKKQETIPTPTPDSSQTQPQKFSFVINDKKFETCKLKSKVNINSPKLNQTLPANVHVRRDSIIWISVALGLEVARISISPDTIQILDRLNRKYYGTSFQELSTQLQFDINFQILQAAIFGNVPLDLKPSDSFKNLENYVLLEQERNGISFNNRFDKSTNTLYYVEANDPKSNTQLECQFKNFVSESDQLVPTFIQMIFKDLIHNEQTTITFEHSKFDFLDRDIRFPFNVPKGYRIEKVPGLKNP